MKWFNSAEQEIRDYLLPKLDSVVRVLKSLTPENFEYDTSENSVDVGCLPSEGLVLDGVNAAVCAADTEKHRILINMHFFSIPKRGYRFGAREFNGKDSQLLTLIHEVTHFNDIAGSKDPYYEISNAQRHASSPQARINADSLSGYVLGVTVKPKNYEIG